MNDKIHVLADESLGGTKREYVEVERKAEVEDYVIMHDYHHGNTGDILKVRNVRRDGVHFFEGKSDIQGSPMFLENRGINGRMFTVLEPTDIVHIEENKYRLVDRKAEVGERVIIDNGKDNCPFNDGHVTEVIGSREDCISVKPAATLFHSEYSVLEPIESESSPKSTDDIIANLVARVADLERKHAELERREEAQRRLNGVLSQRITATHRDIETWAQEIEKVRAELGDKIEMCIDDIVTLDERTGAQEITISVADLAKLIGGVRE